MRVLLKSDGKTVLFLNGANTVNTNDDMWQTFEVECETPLIDGRESLWVVFQNVEEPTLLFNESMLELNFEDGIYRMLFPDGVLALPGGWTFEILTRTYDAKNEVYVKRKSTGKHTFTIQDGLPISGEERVTKTTIAALHAEAVQKIQKETQNAQNISTLQTGLQTTNANVAKNASNISTLQTGLQTTNANVSNVKVALANKVEKDSTPTRKAYGTDHNGNERTYKIGYMNSTVEGEIPMRNKLGAIRIPTESIGPGVENGLNDGTEAINREYFEIQKDILETRIDTVESIAKGANQAKSYADYQTMIAELNALDFGAFRVGQSILIRTLNVPDLWVEGVYNPSSSGIPYEYTTDEDFVAELKADGRVLVGHYYLAPLETGKVDLTDYPTKKDLAEVQKILEESIAAAEEKIAALQNEDEGLKARVGDLETQLPMSISQIRLNVNEVESEVNSRIDTVESIAKGANQAVSFTNYQEMIQRLRSVSLEDIDAGNAYRIGQSMYIVTIDVPDLWIVDIVLSYGGTDSEGGLLDDLKYAGESHVGYFILAPLETQKVNLDEYAKTDDALTKSEQGNYQFAADERIVSGMTDAGQQTSMSSEGFTSAADGGMSSATLNHDGIRVARYNGTRKYSFSDKEADDTFAMLSDLTNYVKFTDKIATNKFGVGAVDSKYGITAYDGILATQPATEDQIKAKQQLYTPIVPYRIDYTAIQMLAYNSLTLTDEEKTSACEWLGALKPVLPIASGVYLVTINKDGDVYWQRATSTATPNSVPVSNSNGNIKTNMPAEQTDCVNKDYVDNLPDYLILTEEQKAKWKTWLENILN